MCDETGADGGDKLRCAISEATSEMTLFNDARDTSHMRRGGTESDTVENEDTTVAEAKRGNKAIGG